LSLPTNFFELTQLLNRQSTHIAEHFERQIQTQIQAQVQVQVQAQVQQVLESLFEQIRLERLRLYGRSSEQISSLQSHLFDEVEVTAASSSEADDVAPIPPLVPASDESAAGGVDGDKALAKAKPRGKRSPLPEHLIRVDIVHEISEADRLCECGTPQVVIGQEVSEQLDIIPMQLRVLRHIRYRYACPNQGNHKDIELQLVGAAASNAVITAPLPPQPLPKTNASADLLAMIATAKYVDGVPLARFEKVLERHGMPISRQTQARWMIGVGQLLQPLHNLARDRLLEGPVIHMDETTVKVHKGTGVNAPVNANRKFPRSGI
jgi:transposase